MFVFSDIYAPCSLFTGDCFTCKAVYVGNIFPNSSAMITVPGEPNFLVFTLFA